jgi:hypothetical protein
MRSSTFLNVGERCNGRPILYKKSIIVATTTRRLRLKEVDWAGRAHLDINMPDDGLHGLAAASSSLSNPVHLEICSRS